MLGDWSERTTPKQRLTATRLHWQLRKEGYAVGVTTVRDYLREWRRQRAEPYTSTITVELRTSTGTTSLMGTLEHGRAAVVEINGFHVHIAGPQSRPGWAQDHLHLLVLRNEDRPGRIGEVGMALGGLDVNIGAMDVGFSAADPSEMSLIALTISRALSVEETGIINAIDGVEDVAQAKM